MASDCEILHQGISATFDSTNCCTLQPGLNCGSDGHASSLILKSHGRDFFITTDLPTLIQSLTQLPRLSYLQLSNNTLSGHIPNSIVNLMAVQYLYLDLNEFVGVVPSAIASMPSLMQLNLDDNFLIGPVPNLAGATKMNSVTMNGNCFQAGATTWTGGVYTPVSRTDCATNPIILGQEAGPSLTSAASGSVTSATTGTTMLSVPTLTSGSVPSIASGAMTASLSSATAGLSLTLASTPLPTSTMIAAQGADTSSPSSPQVTKTIIISTITVAVLLTIFIIVYLVDRRRRVTGGGRAFKTPPHAGGPSVGPYKDGTHRHAAAALPNQQRRVGSDDVLTPFMTTSAASPLPPPRSTSTAGSNPYAALAPSLPLVVGDASHAAAAATEVNTAMPDAKPIILLGKDIELGHGGASEGFVSQGRGYTGSFDGAPDAKSWSAMDVKGWLLNSGFDRGIAAKFELHGITGKHLLQISKEDLQEHLGIAPDAAGLICFAKANLSSLGSVSSAPDPVPPPYQQ
ncbi:hypothetical protein HK101_000462 [Irineochytrium annulatum]|nr:hypothetical protein HK101_000462 [Irineochytrium annulatum]